MDPTDNISAGTPFVSLVEVRGTNNSLVQRPRPDYETANRFLVKARRTSAGSPASGAPAKSHIIQT